MEREYPDFSTVSANDPLAAFLPPGGGGPGAGGPGEQPLEPEDATPDIPGYKIIKMLGKGGMGTVWLARQESMQRDVALKILSHHHFDAAGRARFAVEVELSGKLHHANIARVFDSGLNRGGYYYAMEFIDGVRLDSFAVMHRLPPNHMLQMMRLVCIAVQHAHNNRVIHRDLKPSNILVTADGQPHILDFGLAKLLSHSAATADVTENGEVFGTVAYMPPEQASGQIDRIDTRCDIYSLGKILYELVVGQPAHSLDGSSFEIRRRVVAEEVRWPRSLNSKVDRELEAILLKALNSDPERRYASAGDLAQDIQNFIEKRPLIARPLTIRYVLGKKLARHRSALKFVASALIILSVAAVVGARRLHEQSRQTEYTNAYLAKILKMVTDPEERGGRDSIEKMLSTSDAELSASFAGQRELESDVRASIGDSLLKLGRFYAAAAQFKLAANLRKEKLGLRHSKTLAALDRLAESLWRAGDRRDLIEAEIYARQAYDGRANNAAGHPFDKDLLQSCCTLCTILGDEERWDQAGDLCRPAYQCSLDHWSEGDSRTTELADCLVGIMINMGIEELADGNRAAAETNLAEALQLAEKNLRALQHSRPGRLETLEAEYKLGSIQRTLGKSEQAVATLESLVNEATLNPAIADTPSNEIHPDMVIWKSGLAASLYDTGDVENRAKAEQIYNQIIPASVTLRGPKHRFTAIIQMSYATLLGSRGLYVKAQPLYENAVQTLTDQRGPNNRWTLTAKDALATNLTGQKNWERAEKIYREIYDAREAPHVSTSTNLLVLQAAFNLGEVLAFEKNWTAAEPLLRKAAEGWAALLGEQDAQTIKANNLLGAVRWKQGTTTLPQ